MANNITIQVLNASGPDPVQGNKRLQLSNLAQLLQALNHGSRTEQGQVTVNVMTSVVQASGTVTAAAVQSADTVTIGGTALTATQLRATGTVTAASAQAGDTVTINGVVFTGASGAVTPGAATFSIDTSDTATAASLVAQVAAFVSPVLNGIIGARSAAAVATFYAIAEGTSGNALTLATSNNSRLAKSGAALANGATAANNQFDFEGTDTMTAASIARAITVSTSTAIMLVTASNAAAVVTVVAKQGGTAGNAIALATSNGTRLAKSGTSLASGAESAITQHHF